MRYQHHTVLAAAVTLLIGISGVPCNARADTSRQARAGTLITLIHIGDIHGHLLPRPNLRSDGTRRMEGGLARMYTAIERIRQTCRDTREDDRNGHDEPQHRSCLLVNTGDTIQGSAEALYTRGAALINVLNLFKIDYFAPGNWDFVYGTERFIETFAGRRPLAPWNPLAANLYYDGPPYQDRTGERVLPPFTITRVGNVKIGILGFTTDRGPQALGNDVAQGFRFTQGDDELAEFIPILREEEKVDLLVMISELGLANNIRLAEAYPGVDVILSSDMHEETRQPVVTRTGTIVSEVGQDGTRIGELQLALRDGSIREWRYQFHVIDARVPEHPLIADKVRQVRRPFVAGPAFRRHVNPINGTTLATPIDAVVGHTKVPLHRANFSHEDMPAVVEGSAHDFLADAFRAMSRAEIGVIRGFRYGTHVPPGPITLEDVYHYIPIGPFIARGQMTGAVIKDAIENSADGALNPDPVNWTGGWLFNWSGLTYDLDPYAARGARAQNVRVNGAPLDPQRLYTVASYNYASEPNVVNKIPAANVVQVTDPSGDPLDGTAVVARYLDRYGPANPTPRRIRLLAPLPQPLYRFPEVQPLHGATPQRRRRMVRARCAIRNYRTTSTGAEKT